MSTLAWIELHDARLGETVPIPLDVVEMGAPAGMTAQVLAVEPCPPIEPGAGHVVLTTVNHLNEYLFELQVQDAVGRPETIRTTGYHKFYSATRQDWISAEALQQGERLEGVDGPLTVVSLARSPGVERVYNLTVEGLHIYHVSRLGVLVHNTDCVPIGGRHGDMPSPRNGWESHHLIADSATDLAKDEGAAVLMRKQDHALTTSWRSSTAVAAERQMLAAGRARELFERNMDEVLDIARRQPVIPNDFYDEAVLQAWELFESQGPGAYLPRTQ